MRTEFIQGCRAAAAALLFTGIMGCAASVKQSAVAAPVVVSAAEAKPNQAVQETVVVKLSTGYQREIRKGSVWRSAGSIPQGEVLRPVGTVFTIEGRQVHEAWLVLSDQKLVGFYLPGDQAYSALRSPLSLIVGDVQ
ncbi:hypothetical protein [Achromobacter sp. Bel]|uniref:hypothetical protein n=1 Tax=Achromobacter sp. Bel TaxID=2727415 RepID=UPI00145F3FF5|nr:hypothetical protein [Achromobacter sp. Bel]NMK49301.1 hypothetical protein [Achromobacter sp. Bel]